jgi:hypothetical protein
VGGVTRPGGPSGGSDDGAGGSGSPAKVDRLKLVLGCLAGGVAIITAVVLLSLRRANRSDKCVHVQLLGDVCCVCCVCWCWQHVPLLCVKWLSRTVRLTSTLATAAVRSPHRYEAPALEGRAWAADQKMTDTRQSRSSLTALSKSGYSGELEMGVHRSGGGSGGGDIDPLSPDHKCVCLFKQCFLLSFAHRYALCPTCSCAHPPHPRAMCTSHCFFHAWSFSFTCCPDLLLSINVLFAGCLDLLCIDE